MNREKLIGYLIWAVNEIEGEELSPDYFEHYSNEQLEEEADWVRYLLDK